MENIKESLVFSLWLMGPLVLSGLMHMIVVKKNYFSFLAISLSKKHFGANKTYRGFLVMPLFTAIATIGLCSFDQSSNPFLLLSIKENFILGLIVGFGYMLFELPNSFVKRLLNITPGKTLDGPPLLRLVQILIDQGDSALGCIIAYSFYFSVSKYFMAYIFFFFLGPFIHLVVNITLFMVGLRKNMF